MTALAQGYTGVRRPNPTSDLGQATADIKVHGYCIIPDVLSGSALARVRNALYRAAEEDRARGREQKFRLDYAHDETNQRVWNLLSRDPVFSDLVEHPVSLEMVKFVIGWPALLGNISANITGPGGGEMVLHADQIFIPEPWPAEPQGVNVAWCVDDFTDETGATRIVPGSHLWHRKPAPEEAGIETVPLEAPAGSVIVMESRLWHKTGFNRTKDRTRAGIFAWHTRPIYRQQENWYLSLNPAVRQFASETMLILLGYKAQGLGMVNGKSPA
jgi:ectoine hydroxylase-related dioxygenase (phytanoyl-CoA dioxygenase family)